MILVYGDDCLFCVACQFYTPGNDWNLVAQETRQQISMYTYIEVDEGFYLIFMHNSDLRDSCLEHFGQSGEIAAIIACRRIYAAAFFSCG